MPSGSSFEFSFQASGFGLAGEMSRPLAQTIPVVSGAVLPPIGGVASASSEYFTYQDLVSIGSVTTQLAGRAVAGVGWETTVLVTIEKCNVLDIVSAERISLRLSATQPADGAPPGFSLSGTRIDNLRISGRQVDVQFDPDVMIQQFTFEDLAEHNDSTVPNSRFVASPIFSPGFSDLKLDGNVLLVPNFGALRLCELIVTPGSCGLTMLRVQLSGFQQGELLLATGRTNGEILAVNREETKRPASRPAEEPQMDEPTPVNLRPDDLRLAKGLTEKLITLEASSGVSQPATLARIEFTDEERDIYLGDVVEDSRHFLRTVKILEYWGLNFPCMRAPNLANPIPVSLAFDDQFLTDPESPEISKDFMSTMYDRAITLLERGLKRSGGEAFLETYSAKLVRDYFQTGLERFLGIRFNARRSNISSKPGHFFTVRTNTHGLTVVYGGANYLRARPFQAPTSPVSQWIQPGGWIFGVASSGPNPQWDPRLLQYNVPPDKMARLPL